MTIPLLSVEQFFNLMYHTHAVAVTAWDKHFAANLSPPITDEFPPVQ